MKAIQLEKPQQFRYIDVPEPGAPGPGEALVRVHRVGICGSDYSGYLGKMAFYSYPRIPGHELGVEVLAVGPGVANVKPGDHCAVEPYINCQRCFSCERGHTNCCENHQTLGVHCDGGLRSKFILPARKLHTSGQLSYDQLALVETLAVGCHAANRGNPKPGENVLVIGAGPIGLSVLQFAKLSGARTVVADMNKERLDFACNSMGVNEALLVKGDGEELKRFTDMTNGKLGQVVIDATGSNKSMGNAMNFVGFAGRLVWVGLTTQELSFPQTFMHRREMTIFASRNALTGDFINIIRFIEQGQIDTKPWITHRAAFEEMTTEFPTWLKPESRVVKAVVTIE